MQAQSMVSPQVAVKSSDNVDPIDAMSDTDAIAEIDAVPQTAASDMAEMTEKGRSLGGLAAFVAAWAVMMAAMMLPAVVPMLLLYRTIGGSTR
jgi:predicted metal-binding membrane protein